MEMESYSNELERLQESMENLENRAENMYNSELAYHNFEHHVKSVVEKTQEIITAVENLGISLKFPKELFKVVDLFHDAHYDDWKNKGDYSRAEYYASDQVVQALVDEGVTETDSEMAEMARLLVVGTIPFVKDLKSEGIFNKLELEHWLVRIGDVNNFYTDDFVKLLFNSGLVFAEGEIASKFDVSSLSGFVNGTPDLMTENYFRPAPEEFDKIILPSDQDGMSILARMERNANLFQIIPYDTTPYVQAFLQLIENGARNYNESAVQKVANKIRQDIRTILGDII